MKTTLLIRHLPPDFTDEEKEELLQHFGAVHIQCLGSKHTKNNIVFARFKNERAASAALHRLHQLEILGHCLTVEYAKGEKQNYTDVQKKQLVSHYKNEKESKEKHYQAFLHKLNSWNAGVNFSQPPPAHLKYQYPPPSQAVLCNIAKALASMPKFYTQVLHLMNRMHLPSPFEPIPFPTADIPSGFISEQTPKEQIETNDAAVQTDRELLTAISTEESEIESDPEGDRTQANIIPVKRSLPQKSHRVKRPKFIKPVAGIEHQSNKQVAPQRPEEVFEKVPCEPVQRKIELKLTPAVINVEIDNASKHTVEKSEDDTGGFGLMFPSAKEDKEQQNSEDEKETDNLGAVITGEELAANRISERDRKHLPVFKNYQPGIPSCRLYIKNLAKQVTQRDLHYIYRRYLLPDTDDQGNMYDVRLMTEGRMKGQAFITLQNSKQAELALKETNGFILKDKPLVVQFARSSKKT